MAINPDNLAPRPGESTFTYFQRIVTEAESFGATPGEAITMAAVMLVAVKMGVFVGQPWQ